MELFTIEHFRFIFKTILSENTNYVFYFFFFQSGKNKQKLFPLSESKFSFQFTKLKYLCIVPAHQMISFNNNAHHEISLEEWKNNMLLPIAFFNFILFFRLNLTIDRYSRILNKIWTLNIPRSHVKANWMVFPPAPQNPSIITSQRQRSEICSLIFSGVTENQLSVNQTAN